MENHCLMDLRNGFATGVLGGVVQCLMWCAFHGWGWMGVHLLRYCDARVALGVAQWINALIMNRCCVRARCGVLCLTGPPEYRFAGWLAVQNAKGSCIIRSTAHILFWPRIPTLTAEIYERDGIPTSVTLEHLLPEVLFLPHPTTRNPAIIMALKFYNTLIHVVSCLQTWFSKMNYGFGEEVFIQYLRPCWSCKQL
jgi:hypothetical protein